MDHGRIVEQGTHQSLLSANSYYARLHNAQLSAGTAWPAHPGRADALEAGL